MTVFVDPIDGTREFATAQAYRTPRLPYLTLLYPPFYLASLHRATPRTYGTPLPVLHPLTRASM